MGLISFLTLFIVLLFILGLPLSFSMIVSAIVYAIINDISISFFFLELFSSLDTFVLIAVPLFIMASELMAETVVSERIFDFGNAIIGHIPGGLGHVNVISNIIFSGMSGSAVADVGGIGNLCLKSMKKEGFDLPFSTALTGAASIIGPIIPPSIPMVIYGMVANESVGKLFLGGIIPGLILGLTLMVYVYIVAKIRNYPVGPRLSIASLKDATKKSFLALMTPVILLGSLYGGFCTVTEAAAVAVMYVFALDIFVYRILTPKIAFSVLKRTFTICGPIMFIYPAAKMVGFVLNTENVPDIFGAFAIEYISSPLMILFLVNGLFLFLGCFADPITSILIFVPIVLPLAEKIHLDPIHFGVMIVLNCMIGLITPPVGQVLITLKGLVNLSYEKIIDAIWPFIALEVFVLVIIAVFPATVTLIPSLLYK
jgi:tripartite ATP-independent transporter DctM subunit